MPPILQVEGLTLRRTDGWSVALPELLLLQSEQAALFGPSGAGKSSLLLGLFDLLPDDIERTGCVRVMDREWDAVDAPTRRRLLRRDVAFVLQDAAAALDPLQPIGVQLRQATDGSPDACERALAALGLDDPRALMARLPQQISGGQAQRVLLAVALLRRPALVVADEPSASLDDDSLDAMADQLQVLLAQGSALLLATHDPRLLQRLDPRLYVARDGAFRRGPRVGVAWPERRATDRGVAPLLAASGVSVHRGGRALLEAVDLELWPGEVVALVGPSGAGKSTLARVLAGHQPADQGQVRRPARRESVQLLFQDPLASLTPGRTIGSLLAEASATGFDLAGALAQLTLADAVLARTADELSGGECRRAGLLRALAVAPQVLILDEPTASLDRAASVGIMSAVLSLSERHGVSVLLITHDRELAAAVADRVLTLRGGRVVP